MTHPLELCMLLQCFVTDNSVYDPSSETGGRPAQALSLQRLSNVAEPGLWAFRVDGTAIQSGGMCTHNVRTHVCMYYT